MGTCISTKQKKQNQSNDSVVVARTPKGNKLFQFTSVSIEERNSLRVNVYPYLI